MRVRGLIFVGLILLVAGCQSSPPAPTPFLIPTLMPFPATSTPVIEQSGLVANQPTETTIEPTATDVLVSATATPTHRALTATFTPTPTETQAQATEIPTGLVEPTATPTVPVIEATMTPTLPVIEPTATQEITPFPAIDESRYADMTYQDAFNLLYETPLIIFPANHVREIYYRGQYRGLRDDFLLSVGDCNSESGWYLETLLDDVPPDSGVDASFYENQQIQSTIEHFSSTLAFKGQSVNSGLNAASVLDPFWASADICAFGESPLTCDYSLTDSFASLIMFGANDINVLSTAGYEMAMRDIIETTLERDIIPVLSTFSVRSIEGDNTYAIGVRFNAVLVKLAEEYQIPLVNFFLATRGLADRGILEDNAHLTVAGFNIRNQLTVEVLTQLRTEILTGESNS